MSDITLDDLQEQRARIDRAQEETRKFAAEQHKLAAEAGKLAAEAAKLNREARYAPWQLAFTGFGAGAAVVGAAVAVLKLFGH